MKYTRLTAEEREIISQMLYQNASLPVIAQRLKRATSTISRELARNTCARDGAGTPYKAFQAQERAARTAGERRRPTKIVQSPRLQDIIKVKLQLRWSPRQIAEYLKEQYPNDRAMHVSHETIYTYLYVQAKGTLKKELISYLRQKRPKRQPKSQPEEKRGKITNMISITDRPPEVTDRRIPGHWEGDLVMGKGNKSAIGTLVERSTRFAIIVPLKSHDAETVRRAFGRAIMKLPEHMRLSMTYDQGKEMAEHELFTKETKMQVYFCDPHSPWQRGTNENTNMLVRDFFPKGTDFHAITNKELLFVQHALNERIRETLDWKTPKEVFNNFINQSFDVLR
jgi:transposase, IS30 family